MRVDRRSERSDEMKVSAAMGWAGPAAIVSAVFMIFSDLLNLTIYVPGLGEAAHTGYQAVGSGVILLGLMLLLVGMVGLYARSAPAAGPKVIEYGDARFRYVLVEFTDDEEHPAELVEEAGSAAHARSSHRNAAGLRDADPGLRRTVLHVGEYK
jgi:hypothetical protein